MYETESSEWRKFNSLQRFRHSIWAIDSTIFMHGGFENETPNIPTNSIMKIDLLELFAKVPALIQKLDASVGPGSKRAKSPNASTTNSSSNWDGDSSRSNTPPMQSLARNNKKI